jgi:Tfp pilus assembly protein PilO
MKNFNRRHEMMTERKTPSKLYDAAKPSRARAILPARLPSGVAAELQRPEIVALIVSCLLLLAALLAYFFWLVPSRSHLADVETQYRKLSADLRAATNGVKVNEDTQASVEEIARSLRDFEAQKLPSRAESRTSTIEELNALIHRDGLRLSNGVTFTPLNDETQQQAQNVTGQQQNARGNNVKQSVYPGIGITLSVEGAYPSVRRFLHDIEASGQFIVINSVQIESIAPNVARGGSSVTASTASGAANNLPPQTIPPNGANAAANVTGETRMRAETSTPTGALVNVRLDMAAYFRPERRLSGDESQSNAADSGAPTASAAATSKRSAPH